MDGGKSQQLIGLMTGSSPDLLVGLLGIWKSGHGLVPLDPEYPLDRLDFIIKDSRLELLVTDHRHLAKALDLVAVSSSLKQVVCLDRPEAGSGRNFGNGNSEVIYVDDNPEINSAPVTSKTDPRALAYVIYTSGSTGVPKGVPITHSNLSPLLTWAEDYFQLNAGTRVLQNLSFCFDFGVFELVTTLLAGGTLFFLDKYSITDSKQYAEFIRHHDINTIHSTPTVFREVIAAGGERLDCIRILHLGGEALTRNAVNEIRAVAGDGCVIYNGYGPTETSINCSIFKVDQVTEATEGGPAIPIGKATASNRLYVLDKFLRPVPVGVAGELFVGGPGLSSGYLNRPGLTGERFIPSPFNGHAGARLYRTGDRVRYLPDGTIEFLGRLDHQVKVRGLRIELGEIEAVLARHGAVKDVVVVVDDSGPLPRLIAYVVPKPGELPAPGELRAFAKQMLPPYMAPSVFSLLDHLPLTPNGKIDRGALPAPDENRPETAEQYVAPRNPVEEVVAGICAEVLGLSFVSVDDNLFDLGCHSLLAARIVSRLREALGVELPLRKIFESPNAAGLARALQDEKASADREHLPPVLIAAPDQERPLTFAQEQVWFLNQLDPSDSSYNIPRALRLKGGLNVDVVERVFTEIVRRHEILRTCFPSVDGRPVQIVNPAHPVSIPVVDFDQLPAEAREAEAVRLILKQAEQPFDLARGPLIRLTFYRLDQRDHMLSLIEHHLVHDGWAQGVLLREFITLYEAFSAGNPSPLRDLSRQFSDFATWQRQWLQGEKLESQLAYWKKQLAGAPVLLSLPTDRPRPPVQSFRGAQQIFDIPAEFCQKLRALSRREGATLFMTLLAAFKLLLYRYSGQTEICVGTGVANRNVRETEDLLGMIINTVALRTTLSGNPTFRELLKRVREVCLAAYAHEQTPFEKVVEVLNPPRSLSHAPIFQALFSFLDTPMPEIKLPGVEISVMNVHNSSSKFDLEIILIPHAEQRAGSGKGAPTEGITAIWNYSVELFDAQTIELMINRYLALIEEIVETPEVRIGAVRIVKGTERSQLLEWGKGSETSPATAAPRTPLEELLASIWAEVLGRDRMGIHDNFFALGGDSRLAEQIVSRVTEEFAVELSSDQLFEAPTVAEMFNAILQAHLESSDDQEFRQILAEVT